NSGNPLQLAATALTTNTSGKNGDQFLSSLGTVNALSLNAGSATIIVSGSGASTFKVDGSVASTLTVNGGLLIGNGAMAALTVNSAALQPGDSTGILHTGNLSLATGSTFIAQIGGTTAGSGYNQDAVMGNVNLGGATLNIQLLNNFVATAAQTFILIAND